MPDVVEGTGATETFGWVRVPVVALTSPVLNSGFQAMLVLDGTRGAWVPVGGIDRLTSLWYCLLP